MGAKTPLHQILRITKEKETDRAPQRRERQKKERRKTREENITGYTVPGEHTYYGEEGKAAELPRASVTPGG